MNLKEKTVCAIAGTGYVGLSNAILLSQHNKVYAVDIMQDKVDKINSGESPIADKEIEGDETHLDLISRGIDVNIRNKAGQTALSIAKQHGHKRLIAELLKAGAIDD